MRAEEFNRRYPVGKVFIYQPCKLLRGGEIGQNGWPRQ